MRLVPATERCRCTQVLQGGPGARDQILQNLMGVQLGAHRCMEGAPPAEAGGAQGKEGRGQLDQE